MIDQPSEPIGQNVARDPELGLEFFEMVQAIKGCTQDHETPAFPHRLERSGEAAACQIPQGFAEFSVHNLSPYRIFARHGNEIYVFTCNSHVQHLSSDSQLNK